jgi:hypothetical protein
MKEMKDTMEGLLKEIESLRKKTKALKHIDLGSLAEIGEYKDKLMLHDIKMSDHD